MRGYKPIQPLFLVIPAVVLSAGAGRVAIDALLEPLTRRRVANATQDRGGILLAAYQGEPAPPAVTDLDRRFLTRFVRRTVRQYLEDESLHESPYIPTGLKALKCHALVTIWQHGFHRATGISERRPVLDACAEAALVAITLVANVGPVGPEFLERVTFEIEVVGDMAPLSVSPEALLAGPITAVAEPGIHGLVFQLGDTKKRFTPGQLIADNLNLREAAFRLSKELTQAPEALAKATAARFRTSHWVEREPGGDVIELQRGLVVVPPTAVTFDALAAAAGRIADYLRYRQLPNGSFAYRFQPSEDTYPEQDSPVAQAGAAWALAWYARRTLDTPPGESHSDSASLCRRGGVSRRTGDAEALAVADRALGTWTPRIADLPGVEGAGFVRSPDGRHKLGLTALTCLALTDHPRADAYKPLRDRLVAGMLWLQQPSGQFVTAFPPTDILSGQTISPGQALLALAHVYEQQPQQQIMLAFDRAVGFYRSFFAEQPSAPFAGWQIQAFATMARHGRRDDFADFAFTMADALVEAQLNEDNCPWPEKWGGIAPYRPGAVGAATACYLEGLSDALRLARQLGDLDRVQRYEKAVRLAARFVMQLEFRPEEAYYVRSPRDTIGGVRASLSDNTLRIDHCGRALIALTKARDVLYPSRAEHVR